MPWSAPNRARRVLKAEERYRGIFENSVAGIFQTTPEGTYLDVNPALTRIYGYADREEMMAKISDIARLLYVDPNRRAEFIKLMKERDVVQDFESQIYRKDGSIIWISENARAVRDAEGQDPLLRGHGGRHHRAQGGRGKTALLRSCASVPSGKSPSTACA